MDSLIFNLSLILASLFLGIILGLILKNSILKISNILLIFSVFILIYFIGYSVGNYILTTDIFYINYLFLLSFSSSLVVSFGSMFGSYLLEKRFLKNKDIFENQKFENKLSVKFSFLLAGTIVFSIISGMFFKIFNENFLQFFIQIFLCILIFSAGLSIGGDSKLYENLKFMWKTYIYLPIGAILGSFISGLFIYLLILKQYVLVSSLGMGWYTYTSSFLLSTYGIEASFFGFLQNYLRELLTFFLIPFLSRYFKSYSLIAFGGATTMDNTLPVYILILGKQSTAACLINGIIITFAVPLILFITYFLNYFL